MLIKQISAFLQERDESLWPSERTHEERVTSAMHILSVVYAEQKPLIDMIKNAVDEGHYPDSSIWAEVRAALDALSSSKSPQ